MQNSDKSKFFNFIRHLPKQIIEVPSFLENVSFKGLPNKYDNIILIGMGGSAIAGDLLIAYLRTELPLPFIINRNYTLPNFIGPRSLVIACSYSGNTEETLSAIQTAFARKASIVGIASNGKLAKLAKTNHFPFVQIPEGYPPRQALGYMFFAILYILQKLGIIEPKIDEIKETVNILEDLCERYEPQ